jgi:hypothetical protein
MKINLNKTLEQLENKIWGEPEFDSKLVKTCHSLRKKPLKDFEIEDLRVMIGQSFSLDYMIPIALEKLEKDILSAGDYYDGDLLLNTLNISKEYWKKNQSDWTKLCQLFKDNWNRLENFDTTEEIRQVWFLSFKKFEEIHL